MKELLKNDVTKTFLEALYGDRLLYNHDIFQKVAKPWRFSAEYSEYRVDNLSSMSSIMCGFNTDGFDLRDKKGEYLTTKDELFRFFDASIEHRYDSNKKDPIFFTKDLDMHKSQVKYLEKTRLKLKKYIPNEDFEYLSSLSKKLFNLSIFKLGV